MSTPASYQLKEAAVKVVRRLPTASPRILAPPPPGSGLRPIPGDPGLPLLGHTLGFLANTLTTTRRLYDLFGSVYWVDSFGTQIVMVVGPDGLETVLANRDGAFSSQLGWDYFIGAFFDRGVMLMDGDEHRHHRRILQQAFKRERLVAYLDTMNPAITRGLAAWPQGPGFLMYDATKTLTLNIATEVFMGAKLDAESEQLNEAFIDTVVGGQAFIRADVPGGRWHRGLRSRELLAGYFRSQIPSRRAGDGDDLFSVLCHAESEEGERFSDEDIVNHMIFTMMAAHDTSTITVAMAAFYLARHPEWQDRVREESRALRKPAIGFDDLDALPALDLVFRETLRMNAPVGMVAREAVKDTAINGRYVPAGSKIMLAIYPSQRMEPFWHDPDTFDPERFSPERAEDQSHKFAWVPFGANVHKCIGMHFGGMEVKAILHQLLLGHRISVAPGYEPPMDYGTGPFPIDGLPLELHRI
jgi:cytochrome P450